MTSETENREQAQGEHPQPLAPAMRWWFAIDMVLVFIAGAQLFVLSEMTDQFFAWTIKSTLTAAFLGAAYWSTLPMLWHSFRAPTWAHARIAVPGVWAFTLLTLFATLQHWDKFHWNSLLFTAQFAFWVWLAIYVGVPIVLVILWLIQRRVPGGEPVRIRPLPLWFRAVMGAQVIVLFGVGAALYFFSSALIPLWAWTLTPLTSMSVGAWCIGIGVTTAWGIGENDARRLRGAMWTYALFGVLQLVALVRYAGQADWSKPSAMLYVAFGLSIVLVGAMGVYFAKRAGAFVLA